MQSERLRIAIEALVLLADEPPDRDATAADSYWLAARLSVRASVLRRSLAGLTRAGITGARPGPGGGFVLRRRAREITLGAVYRAVGPASPFGNTAAPSRRRDRTVDLTTHVLGEILVGAEAARLAALDQTTLDEILAKVRTARRHEVATARRGRRAIGKRA